MENNIESIYKLTPMQQGMLYSSMVEGMETSFHIQNTFWIDGELNIGGMRQALKMVSFKYDALRSSFVVPKTSGLPWQVIHKEKDLKFKWISKKGMDEEYSKDIVEKDLEESFDLQKDSLFRVYIVSFDDNRHFLLFSYHHIIMDGWCVSLVMNDFIKYYEMINGGMESSKLMDIIENEKSITGDYKDYLEWLDKQNVKESLIAWEELLEGYSEEAKIIAAGYPIERDNKSETIGKRVTKYSNKLTKNLKKIAVKNNVPLNVVTEVAWGIILQKYNNTNDVVYGKVVSGRNVPVRDVENIVGLFINAIPIRIRANKEMTINKLLQAVNKQDIDMTEHSFCSLADIQSKTKQGNSLINTIYVFENFYQKETESNPSFKMEIEDGREETGYDMSVEFYESGENLYSELLYKKDMYGKQDVELLARRLELLLESIADNPEILVSEVSIFLAEEKELVLNKFNKTKRDYPRDKTIIDLFEEQAEKHKDNTALIFEEGSLTYEQVNNRANIIGERLREIGLMPDDLVVIMAEQSLEMIIGILGILKAGGAYVPIDPSYPKERVDYILDDCEPKTVLLYKTEVDTDIPTIDLSDTSIWDKNVNNLSKINNTNDLAYCLYTSGTTGKPKGCLIENQGVIKIVRNNNYLTFDTSTVLLKTASISFDASTIEIWGPLLNGGKLIISDKDTIIDPLGMKELIKLHKVNTMFIATALFNQMILTDNAMFDDIEYLLIAGEKISEPHVKILANRETEVKLINGYGPTEGTTITTSYPIPKEFDTISIGKPIANTSVYILRDNNPCGIGIPGELCMGGDGLARGYLNRPELTNEKFIDNKFGDGRIYRTGDMARWLPDGNLDFLGRIDEQVKIRGIRIELGEIDGVIRTIDSIKDCVVIVREDSNKEKEIYAYIISDKAIDLEGLRNKLNQSLPEYMVPRYMMQIEELPTTINGKLDKDSLPEIKVTSQEEYVEPRNKTESIICDLFSEILFVEKVGIKDNFFELGGHSLSATRLVNQIEAKTGYRIGLKEIFSNPSPQYLAERLLEDKDKGQKYIPIPKAEKKEFYPMSSPQKRIYLICQMDSESTVYNTPESLILNGDVNIHQLETALEKIIERHEALRTSFSMVDGETLQEIHESVEIKLEYEEDSLSTEEDLKQDFVRPFNLEKAPLLRAKLIKRNENYLLLFDMHHIIGDGMSMETFIREYTALYNKEELKPIERHYKDYSQWMRTRDLSDQKNYWIKEFSDDIPVLDIPLDYKRPQVQSYEGRMIFESIGDELASKIKELTSSTGTTDFMVFLSAAMILFNKYSGQEDIIIGSPISGRTHKDTEDMLGMFVNTLALRGNPEANKSYLDFLGEIKDKCLKAYENQEYPLEELIEDLEIKKDPSRNPLFDLTLSIENISEEGLNLSGLDIEETKFTHTNAKFDITFYILEKNGEYGINLEYSTRLFKDDSAKRILNQFIHILNQLSINPNTKLRDIDTASDFDKRLILGEFNDTKAQYPKDKTIVELIEEQVIKTPYNTAVRFKDEKLTYKEINEKANQLGKELRARGVGKDDFVVIIADQSIWMIVGILGILKAGGAYVPIDPTYPEDRINYILKDCNPIAVLLYKTELDTDIPVINLEDNNIWEESNENLEIINKPNDLAYCLYTSGTTGNPKGCLIENQGVAKIVRNNNYLTFTRSTILLKTASISFDASTIEIWGPLLNGGQLIISEKDIILDPAGMKELIKKHSVNTMFIATSLFNQMILADNSLFDKLEYLLIAGERISESHVAILKDRKTGVRVINGYGPTEGTTITSSYEVPEEFDTISIGKPISNTKVYILNDNHLCGIGVPGELCMGGDGLARGYLNLKELTDEKFTDNMFGQGKIYRTGDMARWLPDGNIEFLGRRDDQVKIRGVRIELGEIDGVVRKVDLVRDCVVIVRKDTKGENALYAYLVSDKALNISEVRKEIRRWLPDYMVPAYMMQIDELPLNHSGKLNKKALPVIEGKSVEEYIPPRDIVEELLCEIFEDVLGVSKVGVRDNFFELGGDSIKAIRVVYKFRDHGYDVEMRDIMHNYTVESIANIAIKNTDELAYEQGELVGKVPLIPIIERFNTWNLKTPSHFNQDMIFEVDLDYKEAMQVLKVLIGHHDGLRSVFIDGQLEIVAMNEFGDPFLEMIDVSEDTNIEDIVYQTSSKIQSSLNIIDGPLIKAALFIGKEKNHLMICVHHLVVDGVSWRILLEDIFTGQTQIKKNEEIKLPAKTASIIDWAEALNEYKQTDIILSQKEYWKEEIGLINKGLIISNENNTDLGVLSTDIKFSKELTDNLIYEANKSYSTETSDLLIAALVMAVGKITGQEKLAISLEGHGREEVHKKVVIDRTVGWFTSIYPVILYFDGELEDLIIKTKEKLRRIPDHGIGYGLLSDIQNEELPDVIFNYLGHVEEDVISQEFNTGENIAEENKIPWSLNINGGIVNGKLEFGVTYDSSKYSNKFMDKFTSVYKNSLELIISHSISQSGVKRTISDVMDVGEFEEDDFSLINSLFE